MEPTRDKSIEEAQIEMMAGHEVALSSFIALSCFTVANGMEAAVKDAFQKRPHLVDDVPGFLRMEVMSPCDDPREIWLFTHWRDEASFKTWHHGHLYHEAHRGIPKGLKLVPRSARIRGFAPVST